MQFQEYMSLLTFVLLHLYIFTSRLVFYCNISVVMIEVTFNVQGKIPVAHPLCELRPPRRVPHVTHRTLNTVTLLVWTRSPNCNLQLVYSSITPTEIVQSHCRYHSTWPPQVTLSNV